MQHILVNLERARISTDLTVRNQIHIEAIHVSTMIYHLGSLFLELGRTISMLHIGDSPVCGYFLTIKIINSCQSPNLNLQVLENLTLLAG